MMTELNPQGVPRSITYPGLFYYRESDVPVTVDALRQGMGRPGTSAYWIPRHHDRRTHDQRFHLVRRSVARCRPQRIRGVSNVVFDLSADLQRHADRHRQCDHRRMACRLDSNYRPQRYLHPPKRCTNAAGASTYSAPVTVIVANPRHASIRPASGSQLTVVMA